MNDVLKTNIDFWEEVVKNQSAPYRYWFEKEKEYLNKLITPNSKVLDVGCGGGRSIFDVLAITQDVVGIDHEEKAVRDAKNNFAQYPSVKIVQADAAAMPFNSEVFDFVICMGTFANFADKKFDVLEEMKRVLKESGEIIISVFSENAFDERMKLYNQIHLKIKEIKGTTVIFDEKFNDNISEQFSENELRNIFSKVSLKLEDITKVGIAYLCTLSK